MASAGRLFAERGYHAVGLGEIGAPIGIAGPTIYQDFPSKLDLLAAILHRGNEALWLDLHCALAEATDAEDALRRVVGCYATIVARTSGVVSALLTEVADLPDGPRATFVEARQDYVREWVGLLRAWRTDLDEPAARVLVHAALAVVTTLTRIDPGGEQPSTTVLHQVRLLSCATLGLSV